MSALNVVKFPDKDVGDVPRALRAVADRIESGEFGGAHNLAWVIDCGHGRIEVGLLGHAGIAGAEAHLLFALAQRKLEGI